jgi:hypothetical protein
VAFHEFVDPESRQGPVLAWQRGEQLIDFIALQVTRVWRRCSLRGNRFHPLRFSKHFGVTHGEIAVKRAKRSEPLVSCGNLVEAYSFDHAQEIQHSLRRQIRKGESRDWTPARGCNVG